MEIILNEKKLETCRHTAPRKAINYCKKVGVINLHCALPINLELQKMLFKTLLNFPLYIISFRGFPVKRERDQYGKSMLVGGYVC